MKLKHVQQQAYSREINDLAAGKTLLKSSSLLSLNPYLDDEGLLRVGGSTGEHPILLPHDHAISTAIVRNYHASGHLR